jgi:hypothetical protein
MHLECGGRIFFFFFLLERCVCSTNCTGDFLAPYTGQSVIAQWLTQVFFFCDGSKKVGLSTWDKSPLFTYACFPYPPPHLPPTRYPCACGYRSTWRPCGEEFGGCRVSSASLLPHMLAHTHGRLCSHARIRRCRKFPFHAAAAHARSSYGQPFACRNRSTSRCARFLLPPCMHSRPTGSRWRAET